MFNHRERSRIFLIIYLLLYTVDIYKNYETFPCVFNASICVIIELLMSIQLCKVFRDGGSSGTV